MPLFTPDPVLGAELTEENKMWRQPPFPPREALDFPAVYLLQSSAHPEIFSFK